MLEMIWGPDKLHVTVVLVVRLCLNGIKEFTYSSVNSVDGFPTNDSVPGIFK